MCISCGCGKPDDDHGDARNITMKDLDQAAQAAGTTRDRVLQNILQGSQPGSTGNGQGGNTQFQSHQSDSNESQAQQNKDAQAQSQPGEYQPSIRYCLGARSGEH